MSKVDSQRIWPRIHPDARRQKFGQYEAIEGKLDRLDSRHAYVTGPASDGVTRPISSHWDFGDAVRKARELAEKHDC